MGEQDDSIKIYAMSSGKLVEIHLPQELEQELQLCEMEDDILKFHCGEGFSLKTNIDRNQEEVLMIIFGVATNEKLKRNNWRKLHGLSMRRRSR